MLFIQNWGKLGVKLKFKQNKRVCDSLQTLDFQLVELRGIEPLTYRLRTCRSPN